MEEGVRLDLQLLNPNVSCVENLVMLWLCVIIDSDFNFHGATNSFPMTRPPILQESGQAMLVSGSAPPSEEWIMDPGATHHLTHLILFLILALLCLVSLLLWAMVSFFLFLMLGQLPFILLMILVLLPI